MKKHFLLLLLLTISITCWSQFTVKGTVISSDDKTPIAGVNVIEKGTTNGQATDADGSFSVNVKSTESVLQFYFIGYIPKDVPVKGRDVINVTLTPDCIRDWFDVQQIGIYLTSGILNNPVGGKLEVAFPAYFGKGTLTSSISYQTDLDDDLLLNADVKLMHFIFNCNIDMDAGWFYRKFEFKKLDATAYSFETNLNFRRFGIIGGFSHLAYARIDEIDKLNGPLLGVRTWIGKPLWLDISGKVAVYRNRQEYFGEIKRDTRYIDVFVKYYKLNSFSEVSIGVGTSFGYRFRKQKM